MNALESVADDIKEGVENLSKIDENLSRNCSQICFFPRHVRWRLPATLLDQFGGRFWKVVGTFWRPGAPQDGVREGIKKCVQQKVMRAAPGRSGVIRGDPE